MPITAPKKDQRGFTLAELLVAMSVFIIVTVVAVGAFIQSLKSERHIVTMVAVGNDVSAALEQMAREIRTGSFFATPNGPSSLSFYDADQTRINYGLSSDGTFLTENGTRMTSSNTVVKKLDFLVSQANDNACNPWRVTILLGVGAAGANSDVAPVYVQTTVSSRTLPQDLPFGSRPTNCY